VGGPVPLLRLARPLRGLPGRRDFRRLPPDACRRWAFTWRASRWGRARYRVDTRSEEDIAAKVEASDRRLRITW